MKSKTGNEFNIIKKMSFLINSFEREVLNRLDEKSIPITRIRFGILYQLSQEGSVEQKALAEWNSVTPQAVHRHIHWLVSHNYLKKQIHKKDGRKYDLIITTKGFRLMSECHTIITTVTQDFFSNLDKKERAQLDTLLDKTKFYPFNI